MTRSAMPLAIDTATLLALAAGLVVLLTAWLPLVLRRAPLSLPIVAIALGCLVFSWQRFAPIVEPFMQRPMIEHVSEIVVLIALMGTGLRIERPWTWAGWRMPARLLLIAMPLTVIAIALLGAHALLLPASAALLLGAVIAPTDPVLASDVQAHLPGEGEGGETRFALTSEAGLNDGLAFPFVLLAMALASAPLGAVRGTWLAFDVVFGIAAGAMVGWLAGRLFGWLAFKPKRLRLSRTGDGLVALGVTLLAYGLTQLVHGYGFIAVFIAAVTLRASHRSHDFHLAMAEFSEQLERLLMVFVMMIFGGALASGLLAPLGWRDVLVGLSIVLVVRPVVGWISLLGLPEPRSTRALVAFFGVRGIGTFYYIAFAMTRVRFDEQPRLVALASFVVLASVIVHGVTSTPLMALADRRRATRS